MPLVVTSQFEDAKNSAVNAPIFIVELAGIGRFYATVDPEFIGQWLFGQGLTFGSGVLFGADLPTYQMTLAQLRDGSIGNIGQALDNGGFARTGQSAVTLLNGGFVNRELQELVLENTPVIIRLGFDGGTISDYLTVFRGVIDGTVADYSAFNLSLVDDTLRNITPLPPQTGTDIFPRSFTQGAALPIPLGHVLNVSAIQTIGSVSGTIGINASATDTEIFLFETTIALPPQGEVQFSGVTGTETAAYTNVSTAVVLGKIYARLTLAVGLSDDYEAGATVTLVNTPNRYAFSFAAANTRRVRNNGGATTAAVIVKNGATGLSNWRYTYADFDDENDNLTATLSSEARGLNLLSNASVTANWTVDDGVLDVFTPGGTFDAVLRLEVEPLQGVASSAYYDVTVETGKPYHFLGYLHNNDVDLASILVGTPSSINAYFAISVAETGIDKLVDTVFFANDATVRVTIIADINDVSPRFAWFDQLDLYDATTENPSVQIKHLIERYMPQISTHAASFAEAFDKWHLTGDRCAGLIQQTEEQQALLGRVAQQFRARTFLNENNEQEIRVFDQSNPIIYFFNESDILKGSAQVSQTPIDEVYTHYFVYFNRNPSVSEGDLGGIGAFQSVLFCTPEATNHSTEQGLNLLCQQAQQRFRANRTKEVFADLIPDVKTAENLLAYHVRRGTHQRYILAVSTFLNAVHVTVGDMIAVSHPLLPSRVSGKRFEVISRELIPNGCLVRLICEEINPLLFGTYTEHWELPVYVSVTRHSERWDFPASSAQFSTDGFFYLEKWEDYSGAYELDMTEWNEHALTNRFAGRLNFKEINFTGSERSYRPLPRWAQEYYTGLSVNEDMYGDPITEGNPNTFYDTPLFVESNTNVVADIITVDDPITGAISFNARPDRVACAFTATNIDDSYYRIRSHTPMVLDMDAVWSMRVLVSLQDRTEDKPIWIWRGGDAPTTSTSTENTFSHAALYFDNSANRFVFSVGDSAVNVSNAVDFAAFSNGVTASNSGALADDTWYQVVCAWNPETQTASIYVDDNAVNEAVVTPDATAEVPTYMQIGTFESLPSGDYVLDGKVAELGLWAKLLTSTEVEFLYNSGDFLLYPFEE